jgi:hypothetical protein
VKQSKAEAANTSSGRKQSNADMRLCFALQEKKKNIVSCIGVSGQKKEMTPPLQKMGRIRTEANRLNFLFHAPNPSTEHALARETMCTALRKSNALQEV